jgi:hypothetical protein
MRGHIIGATIILLLLWGGNANAQAGIRGIFWNIEPITARLGEDAFNYGIGYDHDMNDRLSLGLSLRVIPSIQGWVVNYRSAYHFSDNESGSFYMGPTIGLRSLGTYGTQLPVGMRMGVRGGLERFYADLYIGGLYIIGGSSPIGGSESVGAVDLRTGTVWVGLDLGWGWTGKMKW